MDEFCYENKDFIIYKMRDLYLTPENTFVREKWKQRKVNKFYFNLQMDIQIFSDIYVLFHSRRLYIFGISRNKNIV